jgi:predicted metal-dependent hydrolase
MAASDQKGAFKNRVHHWAEKLDVEVAWLGIRSMRTKWASCSTNGHMNFNVELLALDQGLWDYVIVHELLHFFVPNHGKLWKSLMRLHLGEYETYETELKMAHIKTLQRTC